MEQYISKSAVVAEIRRIMAEEMSFFKDCCKDEFENTSSPVVYTRMEMLLSFLDTLEVKEISLKKDFELTWEDVAWIVNKTILQCRVESTLTAEDICKDVLRQFKAQKG